MAFWPTNPNTQATSITPIEDALLSFRQQAGFVAAALHRSLNGERVALYMQWRTLEGAETSAAILREGKGVMIAASDADSFEIAIVEPKDRSFPVKRGQAAAFGEFWMRPEDQAKLMELELLAALQALQDPGMLTVNFHRGVKGTRMVNYAQVAGAEVVERLARRPGFDSTSAYWRNLARNEYHVYEVLHVLLGEEY
jgi:hypothetical protein